MPTAIKISTELAEEARAAAVDADRSLTGQIEHWARIGKSIEPRLSSAAVAALKRSGGELSALEDAEGRARVLAALASFRDTPRDEIAAHLGLREKVLFEPDPDYPDGLVKINPDGSRVPGILEGRVFRER